jgi:hypothetical protein
MEKTLVRWSRELIATFTFSVLLLLAPVEAHSTVIDLPTHAQGTMTAENQCCQAGWFYTHATETWSFSTDITGRFLYFSDTDLFIDDLGGGDYTVTAHIDHGGNVLGGAFSWISQSVTLGVLSPQIFLSGTISGALREDALGVEQLWATVDYVNPVIAAHTTAPNFAVLSFIGAPCWRGCGAGPEGNAFYFSQDSRGGVVQPDIFGYHVEVDEPALSASLWLLLAAIAAAACRVNRRGYQSV